MAAVLVAAAAAAAVAAAANAAASGASGSPAASAAAVATSVPMLWLLSPCVSMPSTSAVTAEHQYHCKGTPPLPVSIFFFRYREVPGFPDIVLLH